MDAVETIEREGWTVALYVDEDPQSPDDWDNLATFEHASGYRFGERIAEPSTRNRDDAWNVYVRALSIFGADVAGVLPVYLADGGSQGVRVWETDAESANAVLYTTHARLNQLCGEDPQYHDRAWVLDALRGELATWSQYLEGDVYGYVVTRPDGSDDDSCWGFYGAEYAREEATSALDACIAGEAETVAAINRIQAL